MFNVYTDGGCSGNPGPGGWGFVILNDDVFVMEKSGGEKNTTNNKMEMTAVIEALNFIKSNDIKECNVFSDSQYVIKGITEWIYSWKKKGWKNAAGQAVKNKELWMEIDALSANISIKWNWVKGHAGIKWNERVDELTQLEIAKL